jgi:hypothetical protein
MPRLNYIPALNIFKFTVTPANANYAFTLGTQGIAGKNIVIHWGDGTSTDVPFTGYENPYAIYSAKTYSTAGTYNGWISGDLESTQLIWTNSDKVTLNISELPINLKSITTTSPSVYGELGKLPPALEYIYFAANSTNITGDLSELPSTLKKISLHMVFSVTGNTDDLPSGLTELIINNNSHIVSNISTLPGSLYFLLLNNLSAGVTGSINSLPSTLGVLNLQNIVSSITGDIGSITARLTYMHLHSLLSINYTSYFNLTNMTSINIVSCNLSQAEVDLILSDAVATNKNSKTLYINGTTNASPSNAGYINRSTLLSRSWTVFTN